MGYVAVGAAAIVAADVAGTAAAGAAAATELADGGVDAAVSDWGVALVEGSTGGTAGAATSGTAVRATNELSSDGVPFFHQASREGRCAQRGPDWQPTNEATINAIQTKWLVLDFMTEFMTRVTF